MLSEIECWIPESKTSVALLPAWWHQPAQGSAAPLGGRDLSWTLAMVKARRHSRVVRNPELTSVFQPIGVFASAVASATCGSSEGGVFGTRPGTATNGFATPRVSATEGTAGLLPSCRPCMHNRLVGVKVKRDHQLAVQPSSIRCCAVKAVMAMRMFDWIASPPGPPSPPARSYWY